MLNVRLATVLLVLWLGCLYNIERLHEPINLASFVYVFTAVMAGVIICIPKLRTVRLIEVTLVALPIYGLLKWLQGYEFFGAGLPVTVTEICVICVTNFLAWRVAMGIDEFVKSAGEIAKLDLYRQPMSLADGEAELYEEVQRARRFNRNLSLATVSFHGSFNPEQMERLVAQARHEIVRKHLESRVAQQLLASTHSGDILVYHNGEFVLMFPELDPQSVRELLRKVEAELQSELGVSLQVGVADFPNEECTLTGLLNRAEQDMGRLTNTASPEPNPEEIRITQAGS